MNVTRMPTLKCAHISDTHNAHDRIVWDNIDLSEIDLVIHSGDFTNVGSQKDLNNFFKWFAKLPCKYKVCIAGNHDKSLDKKFWNDKAKTYDGNRFYIKECETWAIEEVNLFKENDNCFYLQDEEAVIEGIKIYGSPWSASFHEEFWAFNAPRLKPKTQALYNKIPDDTDILVTHGPTFGNLDLTTTNFRCGCEILAARVSSIKPRFCLSGHIHENYGQKTIDGTTYINSSIMTIEYKPTNLPQVFEI